MLRIILFILLFELIYPQVSWRRPVLPVGSTMERNTSMAGKLLIGTGYEFEYLQDAFLEDRTDPISNPSNERTTSEITSIFLNYSITDKFSVEAVFRLHFSRALTVVHSSPKSICKSAVSIKNCGTL